KLQNVIFRAPGEPVVTDFGLAAQADGGPALSRGGTWSYMAPEQRFSRPVDVRTDVYALGRMLEELLPDAPRSVQRVACQATRDVPADRFQTVAALLAGLERPRRIRRRLGLLLLAPLLVVGAGLLVPAPRGPRGEWHREWGED